MGGIIAAGDASPILFSDFGTGYMSTPFDPAWVTVLSGPREFAWFLRSEDEQEAAGAVELRLDQWGETPIDFDQVRADCRQCLDRGVPVIVTWRPQTNTTLPTALLPEARSDDSLRLECLREVIGGRWGAVWVDLDLSNADDRVVVQEAAGDGVQRIGSRHLHEDVTDAQAHGLVDEAFALGCDASKLVFHDVGLAGVRQALRVARSRKTQPVSVIAAGKSGTASRVLTASRRWGWAYGRLPGARGSADGQPVTSSLRERLSMDSSVETLPERGGIYGVLGASVDRSISPGFHNRLLHEYCGPATRPLFLDFSLDVPDEVLRDDPDLRLAGLAVTNPYKQWARSNASPGSPGEDAYPAWNTLRREPDGTWLGWNTDAPAVVGLLRKHGLPDCPGTSAAILGGGGAALALATGLRQAGFSPYLCVRRPDAVRHAAAACDLSIEEKARPDTAIVINTTGAAWPEGIAALAPLTESERVRVVVEMSYQQSETRFAATFQGLGATLIDAVQVFAEQARLQANVLYGVELTSSEAVGLARAAWRTLVKDR